MPNYKLNVLQRNYDKTGWHNSAELKIEDIKNIKVLNSRNDKSLNAIPSPLARMHLVEAAFSLVYQDELQGTNFSGDAYKKIVSDCLDVFELLYNWNTHIREGKDLKIISWNREKEVENLEKEYSEERQKKEDELRKNQNELQSLNLTQIKGYKEHLVAKTLNLFFQTGVFNNTEEVHIILYNNKPIAGTSPLTGFFTTPNDLSGINLVNPATKRNYFSRQIPFSLRGDKIKNYIYNFFVNNGFNLFPDDFPIRKYFENHTDRIKNIELKLEPLKAIENSIFGKQIVLKSNTEKGVFDYFENDIIKINYRLNDTCFYLPFNKNKERKHDYLLPLTESFFSDFNLEDIPQIVTIFEKDSNTVEVIIEKNNQKYSKTYVSNKLNEIDGNLIDLNESHKIKLDLGIFPFLKIEDDETFNDFYKVMFVFQDLNHLFSNDDFHLKFGKNGTIINPSTATILSISKDNRTVFEKNKSVIGSSYYSLNFCFDFIQIQLPKIQNSLINCLVVPKWQTKKLGNNQIDFAVDFGTTTTFVAYSDDPNHLTLPKKFELNENQIPVAHLNKSKEKRSEWKWIDCFESVSVLPDFFEFIETQKEEFIPSLINSDKYSLPFRTVLYEKNSILPNNKKVLSNSNIAFSYQKNLGFPITQLDQSYITNLKWNVKTNSKFKSSIEVFIEELFHLLRIKTLLSDGNPFKSNISWFSPLSFTPGAEFTYNQIWTNFYLKVFKGNPSIQLKNITESEAPFYYYSKIMADSGGANGIQNTSSVMTLDIGGGTTDLMYFRNGTPVIGTSAHFGANILWGDAYSEFNSEKFNGIFLKLKNTITERLNSTELKNLNEEFVKADSMYGSDEIINFWIWNNDKSNVLDELKNGDFKFSYLLHLSALIFHSCKLLKFHNHPAPKCIIFTGNGSKYLDLIQSKSYIEKICSFFVNEIFENTETSIQVILPSENRKEATCFGGLYQPFNLKRQFEPVNYLGFETPTDNYKKYSEIDLRKDHVFSCLGNTYVEFFDLFFKMNDKSELSFRRHFNIETNLTAVKNFMSLKVDEYLTTGYEKRRKLVDANDDITDSLFFYPFIGLLYQVNKLTKEDLNQYIPKTIYYALSPDGDSSFSQSRLSTVQKSDSLFFITIDDGNPDVGEISIIDDNVVYMRAMVGFNSFLKDLCQFKEFPKNSNQLIQVLNPGKVEKKSNDEWQIVNKIEIEFI